MRVKTLARRNERATLAPWSSRRPRRVISRSSGGTTAPTTLYVELDVERREVRKVEVYADGRVDLADAVRSTGTTWLGEGVTPGVDEINSLGSFEAMVIAKDEFEQMSADA